MNLPAKVGVIVKPRSHVCVNYVLPGDAQKKRQELMTGFSRAMAITSLRHQSHAQLPISRSVQ